VLEVICSNVINIHFSVIYFTFLQILLSIFSFCILYAYVGSDTKIKNRQAKIGNWARIFITLGCNPYDTIMSILYSHVFLLQAGCAPKGCCLAHDDRVSTTARGGYITRYYD
jgi:hypothetical protein